jgi:hypothetical protein
MSLLNCDELNRVAAPQIKGRSHPDLLRRKRRDCSFCRRWTDNR